ncbi:U3 small nucleolar RNA-associated protein 14 homolog B-like isoform X2 [Dysidea avara]|uniref:U3 small nucleolar RNA-associated protein 14 homolog B-like isoform X2 n=1 Tax=Dysidea avara TaxID=196820 RepID=UPI0033212D6C
MPGTTHRAKLTSKKTSRKRSRVEELIVKVSDDEDHVNSVEHSRDEVNTSGDSDDDGNHDKLIADITTHLSSKRKPTRREAALMVSDYNLNIGGQVELSDLIGSLDKTKHYAELSKKLKLDVHQLEQPLPNHQVDKLQREASYREASHELSRWQPIVKKNREADHLVFPLQDTSYEVTNVASLVTSFEPRTPLEMEIAGLLRNSDAATVTNQGLTVAEQKALDKMNIEEARQRRRELQKVRALLTYQEQKYRREKRIKSKRFHKIQRKKQSKLANQTDDVERADKIRAKERMTLKHGNKSKWSQRAARKHKDTMTRQAITEQRHLGNQLKQKAFSQDSDQDDSDHSDNDEGEGLGDELLLDESDNPWMGHSTTGEVATSSNSILVANQMPPRSVGGVASDQLQNIREAFADDDVTDNLVAEFEKEKELEIQNTVIKDTDHVSLPGWGSWAGEGAPKVTRRPEKSLSRKTTPLATRKDAHLKHVIINEKRNTSLSNHKVKGISHPFTTQQQYEAIQRVPVGRLWNSEDSYHHMIRPRVTMATGEVIPPLEATQEIEEEGEKYLTSKQLTSRIIERKRKLKRKQH